MRKENLQFEPFLPLTRGKIVPPPSCDKEKRKQRSDSEELPNGPEKNCL